MTQSMVRQMFGGLLVLALLSPVPAPAEPPEIRLVLQLTVDGLRYDFLARGEAGFSAAGFKRLLEQGTLYGNAHYGHANTETIVGHATLVTGAHPSIHGMTGNAWYDAATGELSYNIEDPEAAILPVREEAQEGVQVDPTQNLARTDGRSPRAMLAETFADRLLKSTGGQARVFSVSGKDRSAVAPGGKGGKAFWYSTDTGDFVTSGYYYAAYPDWVADWNQNRQAAQLAGTEWSLLDPPERYRLAAQDDRPYEVDLRGFGRTFPHRYGALGDPLLYTQIFTSPAIDRLTSDFAKRLVREADLGRGKVTDYLAVSFSAVDAVSHFFGPSSLESEDVMRQLDRTLGDLLDFIDEQIGLEHTLIVLSADHGMAEMPEYATELGHPAGRIYSEDIEAAINEFGAQEYGLEQVARFFFRPFVYLDHEALASAGHDPIEAANRLGMLLETMPGIHAAVGTHDTGRVSDRGMAERIRNNIHPQRSGDIYVVQAPYWFNFEKGAIASMHGSPWRYDTHVPIVFHGPGIPALQVHRAVKPIDVAPTLSALLGLVAPASAQGEVLHEVLGAR